MGRGGGISELKYEEEYKVKHLSRGFILYISRKKDKTNLLLRGMGIQVC